MAERRMFAKTIVLSDAFLDMSLGARCLYMTLGMVADDDGFVNNPKSIMRQCGAQEDDLKILFAKKFLIPFESGVVVIKHWRINNYLQKDRYRETKYIEERSELEIGENGSYRRLTETDQDKPTDESMYTQDVYTQDRLGKDSIGKDRLGYYIAPVGAVDNDHQTEKTKRFTPPSVDEVRQYCMERGNNIDAEAFVDHYASVGWKVGKNPMKDWKAAVRTWERYRKEDTKNRDNGIRGTSTGDIILNMIKNGELKG